MFLLFQHFGEFDVEASKVLETNNRLMSEKFSGKPADITTTEYTVVKEQYGAYLKASNNIDLADVYVRVKEELPNNEVLQRQLAETNFLMLGKPFGKIEVSNFNTCLVNAVK